MNEDKGFLSRWSQRKAQARQGGAQTDVQIDAQTEAMLPETPRAAPGPLARDEDTPARVPGEEQPPPPTLDDVALLTRESDYARFVARDVSGDVRNAALKKLFTDPHFNVMDGLDTYIDDYNTPDPLPASMLRQMAQAVALGLADPEPTPNPASTAGNAPAEPQAADLHAAETKTHDENPALRLQPLDAPGPPGLASGAGEDTGRQR
ncbi:DUF3306 domain-containing protein [Hydrogenophaga sp. BPS33]|uniref:DUF3306 domain-containing protein n=1 Tax=Hydrogenophaga sp. BPS33 TaxID=2651974 RepID=UPI0013204F34|nr:DUF3306 domain-containing protein [Hydrogenophaga sp. BPS33]QHE84557.1 DUF3306 domain-containing protein [Hydrogenophaga sp. BPS33]